MTLQEIDKSGLMADLLEIAPIILKYSAPVWKILNEKRKAGSRILFEGAQGALLDILEPIHLLHHQCDCWPGGDWFRPRA